MKPKSIPPELAARMAPLLLDREYVAEIDEHDRAWGDACGECGAGERSHERQHVRRYGVVPDPLPKPCETAAVCDALRALGYGDPHMHADACPCEYCAERVSASTKT